MSARDNILNRVRSALGRSGPPSDAPNDAPTAAVRARLRDHPRGPLPSMDWEPLARFEERCLALSSSVARVGTLAEVPAALAQYVTQKDLPRSGVCWPELAGGWARHRGAPCDWRRPTRHHR